MCPSPTPSYTSPGRKAATPSPHPVARDPWRSSMLFHLQKNVSLCGTGQGGMWRHPYCLHGLLWISLLYASGLRYPEDSVSCCVLPDSTAEKERHRSLAKKLSLFSLLHSSGIAQGPSFVGRSHKSSSFPWLGLELLLEGVTCSTRLCL